MRLDDAGFARLLRAPERYRVVLLHGDDRVLVAERAERVVAALSRNRRDVFGPAEIDGLDHVRAVEALAAPRFGGGCVVRLRDATDAATPTVGAVLRVVRDGCLVIEAGTLQARSKLRILAEGHGEAGSVWCRGAHARQISEALESVLVADDVTIVPEARAMLLVGLSSYGDARAAASLLVLLVGASGVVGVSDVMAVGGADQESRLEALGERVMGGDDHGALAVLETCLAEGVAPVAVLRSLLLQFARLRGLRAEVFHDQAGVVEDWPSAVSSGGPTMGRSSSGQWSGAALDRACAVLWRADLRCRQTGAPVVAWCRDAVQALLAESGLSPSGGLRRPSS